MARGGLLAPKRTGRQNPPRRIVSTHSHPVIVIHVHVIAAIRSLLPFCARIIFLSLIIPIIFRCSRRRSIYVDIIIIFNCIAALRALLHHDQRLLDSFLTDSFHNLSGRFQ